MSTACRIHCGDGKCVKIVAEKLEEDALLKTK
jgi:hypothetical protein